MAWLSFTNSNKNTPSDQLAPPPSNPATEQRSHGQSVNMPNTSEIAPTSDLAITISQITTNDESSIKIKPIPDSSDRKVVEANVLEFVNEKPNNMFVIDGERDKNESIICTSNNGGTGKTCLKMKVNLVELFGVMQKMEYFCSLPNDVDATYFECRKIK